MISKPFANKLESKQIITLENSAIKILNLKLLCSASEFNFVLQSLYLIIKKHPPLIEQMNMFLPDRFKYDVLLMLPHLLNLGSKRNG